MQIVIRTWNGIRSRLAAKPASPGEARVISDFFGHGSQYYVAGRYAVVAALMPIAGNLLHHAIEMYLKGALSKEMSPDQLRNKFRHRLPKLWKRVKRQIGDRSLSKFDSVIKELSKFEDIRYPDKFWQQGASITFDITKTGAAQGRASGQVVPRYKLCLEDIDELVDAIFRFASRNPNAYLRFMKPEASEYVMRDNAWYPHRGQKA